MMNRNLKNYDVKNISPEALDSGEKMLLFIFLSMRNLEMVNISIERLAWQSSLSESTVKRKIKSLEKKGLLERIFNGFKQTKITKVDEEAVAQLVWKCSPKRKAAMNEFLFAKSLEKDRLAVSR